MLFHHLLQRKAEVNNPNVMLMDQVNILVCSLSVCLTVVSFSPHVSLFSICFLL